jgi:hypothetical protein
MRGEAHCPVCYRAAGCPGTAAACAGCGWKLNTGPRAGVVTEDMRRNFDASLRAAREARAERDEAGLRAALGDVVAAVRPDHEAAVITVGLDGIGLVAVSLDAADSPRADDGWRLKWADVLPGLPKDKRFRDERLIEGVPGLDRAAAAALVRDRLPAHGAPALVVCRPAGARVLETVAEAIAVAARPAARLLPVSGPGSAPMRELAADAAAREPLRRPYYLLTAQVDASTGAVRPVPEQLFAAGAAPGARARLSLRRVPGDVADVTVAIFAGNGHDDWSRARPLALYQVPLPGEPDPEIVAVLDAPGRVRVTRPPGAVSHPDTWAQVYRRMPARIAATVRSPFDLVCAVDLSGPDEAVRKRTALVHDLIGLASRGYPEGRLRVAVVTCTDHHFGLGRGDERDPVIESSGFGAAAEALDWLAGTEAAPMRNLWCAPVEDLLEDARGLLASSGEAGRRPTLLTVAGHPPYPFPQRQGNIACPRHISWKDAVITLDQMGVRRVAVVDTLPSLRSGDRGDWKQIGSAGLHEAATVTVPRLAEELGLLIPPAQRVPLPLTDNREGARA